MRQILRVALCILVLATVSAWAQTQPLMVPIPGGDVIPNPDGTNSLWNVFSPGVGPFLDGRDAEPNIITNFNGQVAMGYTLGTATDNKGNQYAVLTDIRVYQGDYVGGVSTYPSGGATSARAHGTFVLI